MMVQFHRTLVIALHLRLIGVLQDLPRASQGLLIHAVIVSAGRNQVKGTKVLAVQKAHLSVLTGPSGNSATEWRE